VALVGSRTMTELPAWQRHKWHIRRGLVGAGGCVDQIHTDQQHCGQSGGSAETFAERLNDVHAAKDLVVLVLTVVAGVFVEEELVGFVLGEMAAVDHQQDKARGQDDPGGEYDIECVHGGSPRGVTSGPDTGRRRWSGCRRVGWALGRKLTPYVVRRATFLRSS